MPGSSRSKAWLGAAALTVVAAAPPRETAPGEPADALIVGSPQPDVEKPRGAYDVYLLAGQSNMSGRGFLGDTTAAERQPDPNVLLFGNDERWRLAVDPLDYQAGQVDHVSLDPIVGVGPGLSFGRAMAAAASRPVVLVPCAKGGSAMAEWDIDGGRETLLGSCVARVAIAGGRVAGLLWYQGEADGRSAATAAGWGEAFARIVARFREKLGTPGLPVVFVGLSDKPRKMPRAALFPYWQSVQEHQEATHIACVGMVSARGLPHNADDVHLSAAAQGRLGPKLATAMLMLRQGGCGR
ncbi:sialate O-acetylesterase [Sphingomonas sp.]|uniref:sialate O-acetylesterase n=1 Tax=Sphingomonas sp. TaxID=28214 RepID=UPI000DB75765|nr:sialate O-acetylesterase [Sphingomonas sp.]PZU06742.1 MAG: sialate O-acetylesterase [Sphingomonas sp.]